MSSNPTKSEATNAETTKNPKEASDWLGGPQNGDETPRNGGSVQGVDTQTGSQAKGMGSDGFTKHRFNENTKPVTN